MDFDDEYDKVEDILNEARLKLDNLTNDFMERLRQVKASEHAQAATLMTIYQEYHDTLVKKIKEILPKVSEAAISHGLNMPSSDGEYH